MSKPAKKLTIDATIVQDNVPSEVVHKLYIGSLHAAFNQDELVGRGITHVLNVSRFPASYPKSFTYLSIDIRDKENANLLACIPAANIFIDAGIESGGVLVHCSGGRSRSSAFVAAYLMATKRLNFDQVYGLIRSARPVADINISFINQLRAYSITNFDVYSAQQVLLRKRIRSIKERRKKMIEKCDGFGKSGHGQKQKRLLAEGPVCTDLDQDSEGSTKQPRHSEVKSPVSIDYVLAKNINTTFHGNGLNKEDEETTTEEGLGRAVVDVKEGHSSGVAELEIRAPVIRLSRPGSATVRVIPPVRGLNKTFCCSWCSVQLFSLGNVIRLDEDISPLVDAVDEIESHKPTCDDSSTESGSSSRRQTGGWGSVISMLGCDMATPRRSLIPPPSSRAFSAKPFDFDDQLTSRRPGAGAGAETGSNTLLSATLPSERARDTFKFTGFEVPSAKLARRPDSAYSTNTGSFLLPDTISASFKTFDTLEYMDKDSCLSPNNTTTRHIFNSGKALCNFNDEAKASSTTFDTLPPLLTRQSTDRLAFEERKSLSISSTIAGSHFPQILNSSTAIVMRNGIVPKIPTAKVAIMREESSSVPEEESPRIPEPPEPNPAAHFSELLSVQSTEKRRWLARFGQLRTEGDSEVSNCCIFLRLVVTSPRQVSRLAQADDVAAQSWIGDSKYIHVEYLDWMGDDPLRSETESGHISCRQCGRVVGSWFWNPTQRQSHKGLLEPPVFRISKTSVREEGMDLDSEGKLCFTPRTLGEI